MVIMISLAPRDAPYQISILLLLLLPASASPGDWQILPSVRLRSSYSDNAQLAPQGQAHGELITEVAPALSVSHAGPRLRLAIDYTLDLQQYSRQGQRSTQQLDAAGHAEVLPDWLYLDANAAISQQSISTFGAQAIDARLNPAQQRSVRTRSISPYLQHRWSGLASATLRYSQQQVSSGALLDVKNQSTALQIDGDHAGPGWNWGLSGERSTLHDAVLPTVRSSSRALTITDTLNSQLALFANAGYEQYDYQANGKAPQGKFHSFGADWTPSPRSRLKASVGRRYFGNTYSLDAEYRLHHSYWSANYSEDISTTHGELLRVPPAGLSDFLDQLWTSRIPDRATRQQTIKVFLLISQMLGPDGNVNFFSHRYYLQKRWHMATVVSGTRSTLAFDLSSTARTAQTSSAIDSPLLGPDQLMLEDRTRQQALQVGWNWRLAPSASLTLGGSLQRVQSLQTGRRDRNSALTLAYTSQLRSDVSFNVDLRQLRHTSNVGARYRENGIGAALNVAF